ERDAVEGAHAGVAVAEFEHGVEHLEGGRVDRGHRCPPRARAGSTRVIRMRAIAAPRRPSAIVEPVATAIASTSRSNGIESGMIAPIPTPAATPIAVKPMSRMAA